VAEQGRRRFADVRRFEELDSTNTWLLEGAATGLPEGVVVVADRQRAGRGRLGRRWESPSGSGLLLSILFRPDIDPSDLFSVSALVGLSARDACSTVAAVTPDAKWPNDLVVDDVKLAGLLSETAGVGSDRHAVVVGVGINVSWPMPGPEADELGATCLAAASGRPVERAALLGSLLDEVERRRPLLDDARGRAQILDELARCTVTLGRRVRVELPGETFSGTATGLDGQGRLLVEVEGRQRVVAAGDVVHLR
jgi:BirA family biotin operon repressor/biotin-[acetyl-CoA-carboxylase] ligase